MQQDGPGPAPSQAPETDSDAVVGDSQVDTLDRAGAFSGHLPGAGRQRNLPSDDGYTLTRHGLSPIYYIGFQALLTYLWVIFGLGGRGGGRRG